VVVDRTIWRVTIPSIIVPDLVVEDGEVAYNASGNVVAFRKIIVRKGGIVKNGGIMLCDELIVEAGGEFIWGVDSELIEKAYVG